MGADQKKLAGKMLAHINNNFLNHLLSTSFDWIARLRDFSAPFMNFRDCHTLTEKITCPTKAHGNKCEVVNTCNEMLKTCVFRHTRDFFL